MAFLYPLGGNRALLAAYVAKDLAAEWARQGEQSARLLEFFTTFPEIPKLDRAQLESPVFGYPDYPNLVRKPVHAEAAFIGDAAISLDPMSGVGCAFAMVTADLLVEVTSQPLIEGGDLVAGLDRYSHRFGEVFSPHAQGIAADSLIAKSPATMDAVYGRIRGDASLQRAFIALTGRLITPAEFQRRFLAAGMKARQSVRSHESPSKKE